MNKKILLNTLLIFLCVLFTGCSKKAVDLSNYVKITTSGYDGKGVAAVEIDYDSIEDDFGEDAKFQGKGASELKLLFGKDGAIDYFMSCLDYDLENTSNLSNGDTVKLEWDIDEDDLEYVNLKVKAEPIQIKVKNLEEVEYFDPFEYIDVSYTGTAPEGQAIINVVKNDDISGNLSFSASKSSGLSNDEKIKITVSLYYHNEDSFLNQFGKLPKEYEKEYTVSGLSSYLTSASEVDDAAFNKMDSQARDVITGWGVGKEDDVEYIGNYWLNDKGIHTNSWTTYNKNMMFLVYKITDRDEFTDVVTNEVSQFEGVSYFYICYYDLRNIDGSVWVDVTNYYSAKDKNYEVKTDVISYHTNWYDNYYSLYYLGYKTLDEIYKVAIIDNIENYSYEENITE